MPVCTVCGATLSRQYALIRHMKKLHRVVVSRKNKFTIICPSCSGSQGSFSDFINHVKDVHHINIESEELKFKTDEDFDMWREGEEKREQCKFVATRSERKTANQSTKITKLCNRSGVYAPSIPLEERQRGLKKKGSLKMGATCTAHFVKEKKDESIVVKYFKTHLGHTPDSGRLGLTNNEKALIATKLQQGITPARVLRDVAKMTEADDGGVLPSRLELTDKQDLRNISKQFEVGSDEFLLHRSDDESMAFWIANERLKGADECAVLFVKGRGDTHPGLKDEDFFLVLQWRSQRDVLEEFGHDRICMDSTHGICGGELKLMTIMVVDELNMGRPVAFCLCRSECESDISFFLEVVKERCGVIRCKVLMTDDAAAYRNAWGSVMGQPERVLICAYHVLQAWKRKFHKSGDDEYFQELRKILFELSLEDFNSKFDSFLATLHENRPELAQYLVSYYGGRRDMWAYAYRLGLGINCNMLMENFHKRFKHIELEGKKTRRIDKCVLGLRNFVNDTDHQRLVNICRGKTSYRDTEIWKRHKEGMKLKTTVRMIPGIGYVVPSQTTANKLYTITPTEHFESCEPTCGLRCDLCKVCYEAVKCPCMDYSIKAKICKHVHAFVISLGREGVNDIRSKSLPAESQLVDDNRIEKLLSYRPKKSSATREECINFCSMLNTMASDFDEEQIPDFYNLLKSTVARAGLIKGKRCLPPLLSSIEPANKNIEKQRRYTAKQRKSND